MIFKRFMNELMRKKRKKVTKMKIIKILKKYKILIKLV